MAAWQIYEAYKRPILGMYYDSEEGESRILPKRLRRTGRAGSMQCECVVTQDVRPHRRGRTLLVLLDVEPSEGDKADLMVIPPGGQAFCLDANGTKLNHLVGI